MTVEQRLPRLRETDEDRAAVFRVGVARDEGRLFGEHALYHHGHRGVGDAQVRRKPPRRDGVAGVAKRHHERELPFGEARLLVEPRVNGIADHLHRAHEVENQIHALDVEVARGAAVYAP